VVHFREDLYYRSLMSPCGYSAATENEKTRYFFALAGHFCLVCDCANISVNQKRFLRRRMHSLLSFTDWPGNVNVRFALTLLSDYVLMANRLFWVWPDYHQRKQSRCDDLALSNESAFEKTLFGKNHLRQRRFYKKHYDALGLTRKTLYDQNAKYGLDKDIYKPIKV